jgi:hypothetical protein
MKQTAVEWQHIELSKFLYGKSEFTDANDILIKAKEMEKELMMKAFDDGKWDSLAFKGTPSEDWYNKTFNTKE